MRKNQAAAYLGISGRTLDRIAASGAISPVDTGTGRTILYRRHDLDSYLDSLPRGRGQRVGASE